MATTVMQPSSLRLSSPSSIHPAPRTLLPALILGLSTIALIGRAEGTAESAAKLLGFTTAHVARQLALEKRFDAQLDPADQRAWLERMSAEPNHVGSPHNRSNAEFLLEKFREWGWQARLESFSVLYPTPKQVALEMVAPTHFTARL